MTSDYALLRQRGEMHVDPQQVPALRRAAKRDGLALSQSTTRDYMGRPTTVVALHDGQGNIVRA